MLANVDVPNFIKALKLVKDAVRSIITVGVGAYMLDSAVGPVFVGPLLLALISIAVPALLGKKLVRSQRRALGATEKRLRSMTELVSNARGLRIGGVQHIAVNQVLENRQHEIIASSLYRKIFILVILAGKLTVSHVFSDSVLC